MPGSRALFYRPPFVSWVGHLSFVLRSLPLRSLRSLRETNGGYEWRTEDGTKTRQRRYEVKGTWRDRTERVTNGGGERCERRAAPFLLTFVTIAAFRSLSSPGSGLNLPPCFRRLSVTARVSFLSSLNTPVHIIDLEAVGMEWGDPTSGVETAGKGYDVMRECRGTWEQEIDSFWLVFPWLGS